MKEEAIRKLYHELDLSMAEIKSHEHYGYITEHTLKDGREVIWYFDGEREGAICIDTGDMLNEGEVLKLSDNILWDEDGTK